MKLSVEVDCTPEEARRFLGLPDVSLLNEKIVDEMRKQVEANMATIRYLVRDVDEAIAFYTEGLGFERVRQFGPAMAMVRRGDLTLWLAGPSASAAKRLIMAT